MGKKTARTARTTRSLDEQLANSARLKIYSGKSPNTEESKALRRIEKAEAEELRTKHYQSVPKAIWRTLSGRQAKILNEQAAMYNLPIGGRTINLEEFIPAFHDFLARHKKALSADRHKTDASERLKIAQAEKTEIEVAKRRGELRPAEDVQRVFDLIAEYLRKASKDLRSQCGERAYDILAGAVHEAELTLQRFLDDTIDEEDAED